MSRFCRTFVLQNPASHKPMKQKKLAPFLPEVGSLPTYLFSTLGVLSLFQGNLDLNESISSLIRYYRLMRDTLFLPVEFIGFTPPGRLKDFFFVFSVYYFAAVKSEHVHAQFAAICFFGSLVFFFPFIITGHVSSLLTEALMEYISSILDASSFEAWIVAIPMGVLLVLFISLTFSAYLGAASFLLWLLVFFFPPAHKIHAVTDFLFKVAAELSGIARLRHLSLSIYIPGFFVYYIANLLRRKERSMENFIELRDTYSRNMRLQDLPQYYIWLFKQFSWTIVAVLLVKITSDTLAGWQ